MKLLEKSESTVFYIVKAFALYSIVLAHSNYVTLQNEILVKILGRFATVGVFVFFFISGYYYTQDGKNHKYSLQEFWKRKLFTILIPWFLNASAFYGLLVVTNEIKLHWIQYSNWILGNGSFLYYMTILIICYIVGWEIVKLEKILWICVILNIISVYLTAAGILNDCVDAGKIIFSYWNPLLNIFNWLGIFVLGILAKKYGAIQKLLELSKKKTIVVVVFGIILTLVMICVDNGTSYWTWFSLILETILALIMFLVAAHIPQNIGKYLRYIGNITLPIYFWHMLIVNLFFRDAVYANNLVIALIRPVVTIGTMALIVYIMTKIAQKFQLESLAQLVLGIRIKSEERTKT